MERVKEIVKEIKMLDRKILQATGRMQARIAELERELLKLHYILYDNYKLYDLRKPEPPLGPIE